MVIWTNFNSFAITYLISVACFKNYPKLFSKVYSLFYALAFDDVMKLEYLKF